MFKTKEYRVGRAGERKDEEKLKASRLSDSVNGVEARRSLSHHGDCLPPKDRSELCAGQQGKKTCQVLSNSKQMVFNVKKLPNDDADLTL